jgi:hypothetical protein
MPTPLGPAARLPGVNSAPNANAIGARAQLPFVAIRRPIQIPERDSRLLIREKKNTRDAAHD